MVTTLIKHEALRTRNWLGVLFGAATLGTVIGTLMEYTPWALIQGLGFTLTLVAVFGFLLIVQLALAFDYWRSSYRQTGYFTHSLPVKGSTIYGAKLLWGSVITVVALLWNVVLGAIALFGAARFLDFPLSFSIIGEQLTFMFGFAPAWVWVVLAVVFVVMYVGGLAQYYFAASIGSESRLNRLGIGGPIIVWFVLYLVMQAVLFVGIIAVPLGLTETPDGTSVTVTSMNFLNLMVTNQEASGMPLGFIPVMVVATALLIWRTVVSWNAKTSLA